MAHLYRVRMGSFVTKLMKREFAVVADNDQEAIEKAEKKFRDACERQVYTECGETVNCDSIRKIRD